MRRDPSPADETAIAGMINSARESKSLPRVRMQDEIRAAARRWSVRMATSGEFEHSRLGWAGDRPAGENISIRRPQRDRDLMGAAR